MVIELFQKKKVLLIKNKAKPFDLAIIQVYAPTSECEEDIIEHKYEKIEKAK